MPHPLNFARFLKPWIQRVEGSDIRTPCVAYFFIIIDINIVSVFGRKGDYKI